MVWTVVPLMARIMEVKVTLTVVHPIAYPKGIEKAHVLARSLAVKAFNCSLISLARCVYLLFNLSVSLSISILLRVHASVLSKVALIVSAINSHLLRLCDSPYDLRGTSLPYFR